MSVSCTLQLNTAHGRLRDIAEMCMLHQRRVLASGRLFAFLCCP